MPQMDSCPTIFNVPHHRALELMATRALASGQWATAFELADRRCRVPPPPSTQCFLLRAEASHRMGETAAAISDLDCALEISPDDIVANRKMLAWGQGARQRAAAAAVIARDRDRAALRAALAVLHQAGRRGFASLAVFNDVIQGWAAWSHDGPLELSISGSARRVIMMLDPDPFHALAGPDLNATDITATMPQPEDAQSIALATHAGRFHRVRVRASHAHAVARARAEPLAAEDVTTVIVPVYRDYDATKACIESLLRALQLDGRAHALIVCDASPDPRIRRYVADIAATPMVDVLINATNMGFVGAVNRALEHVRSGDVVLLNADTIVPAGFLERLRAAAAPSDIATVTPLSNNGEFMSFPKPNEVNPLISAQDLALIDGLAARVNRGVIVDLPSGIGFCLYISRRCLDRIGGLSERIERGYLEDVEFCLRAREHGMRAVCATDLYVAHVGSRSFRHEKKSLVARNFKVLETSAVRYARECLAFVELDSLRPARAAIEQAMRPRQNATFLVSGNGALAAVATQRARRLASPQSSVIICEIRRRRAGTEAALFDPAGGVPQSLQFDLAAAGERQRLVEFVGRSRPCRIEFLDPASTPGDLAEALCGLGLPYDFFVADAGLADAGLADAGSDVPALASALRSGGWAPGPPVPPAARAAHDGDVPAQQIWARLADGADQILVPCRRSEGFARRFLSKRNAAKLRRAPLYGRTVRVPPPTGYTRIGFVAVRASAYELKLMRETARLLKDVDPQIMIVVLGDTLDDLGLMRFGNVFVSGAVSRLDLPRLVRQYRLDRILPAFGPPLFGHPVVEAALDCGLPAAYPDWSLGASRPRRGDLAINPLLSCREIAAAVAGWIAAP